eukprot:TRINITY_DN8033_c0_g2_i1.p1 TRINITY_DN8033_c0_g2~~TRINITY_DN8033_c0_g2_i1.p1  ORF type:complete len:168 (+),score=66.39 TRINITY_DN8033_c0_g2_i1:70-504(+)
MDAFHSAVAWVQNNPVVVAAVLFFVYLKWKASRPFPETGGRVQTVDSMKEWEDVLSKNKVVCADFFATWCPPCRSIAPWYGQLSTRYEGVTFVKIDVDKCRDVASLNKIQAMPTFKVFVGGLEKEQVQGASQHAIEQMVMRHSQ